MVPLAAVYGRSVYGPETEVDPHYIETATTSLDQTRARLTTRYSMAQRLAAAYRPTSIVPARAKRAASYLRGDGRNGKTNGR